MRQRARKGGEATSKKLRASGLDTSDLPPLRSHEDAQHWLETIGRAVLVGQITDRQAQAAVKAVSEWIKAYGERLTVEVVTELRQEVDRLKAEMGSKPQLRATR